jgi:tetratricopeptide (TPR) repeat protein
MNLLMWRPTPRTLVIGILSTLALVLVGGGAWFWYGTQQERIQAVHADALSQAYAVRNPQAAADARARASVALESALTQAPNAPLAMQSAYELGNIRFDNAQYDAARAAYDIALRNARTSATLRALARAGSASTWEAQRDFPRAVEAYTVALADAKPGQFYYEELLISLGRVQELAGRRDDAIQSYRRLLKDVPKLKRESEVRGRLASLGVASDLR